MEIERADARTRTGDPFITRDGSVGLARPETTSRARVERETVAGKAAQDALVFTASFTQRWPPPAVRESSRSEQKLLRRGARDLPSRGPSGT
jgi:hypothetical protein